MSISAASRIEYRVRFLSCAMGLVFLLGWGSWFWPFDDLLDRQGTPLGADFSMFYVAGQVTAEGQIDRLYDQAEHQRRLRELFPGLSSQFCLPYRYPPVVAAVMAPLSRLPYPVAWGLFSLASFLALGTAVWMLSRSSREVDERWRRTAIWACIGWPVVWEVIAGGQASLFGLLIAASCCVLLQRQAYVWTGALLGLAAYKPNLLALFAVGIAVRHPRVLFGAIPVAVGLAGFSWAISPAAFRDYLTLTQQLASRPWDVESPFWKVHSLAAWFDAMAPGSGRRIALLIGLLAAVAVGFAWRRRKEDEDDAVTRSTSLALLLAVNGLFNPYTPIYDLALLAAAGWMTLVAVAKLGDPLGVTLSRVESQCLLSAVFFLPHLSQGLARPLGVQLFPLALAAVTAYILGRMVHWRMVPSAELSRARGGWKEQVGPQGIADNQPGTSEFDDAARAVEKSLGCEPVERLAEQGRRLEAGLLSERRLGDPIQPA